MRLVHRTTGEVVEGAAGPAVAGALRERDTLSGKRVAVVVCGGNVTNDVRERILTRA